MTIQILSAEFVGNADVEDGFLDIGGIKIDVGRWGHSGQGVGVYVRRDSETLAVIEIALARHDGLAQEELDRQNYEATIYPLGAKEYWRGEMVGKYTYGVDQHLLTDEEFEEDWDDE